MNDNTNNNCLIYIRVSSEKQKEGMSPEEQRRQILAYVERKNLKVVGDYEEAESASQFNRPKFNQMISSLKELRANSIVFHSVDRSARNLEDASILHRLLKDGYELHFVAEGIDTTAPIGKSMVLILWGMASSFSENLKFHIGKGIEGLLENKIYPNPAPIGYLNPFMKKSLKLIDPVKGPLVKRAFELYATGNYSLVALAKVMNNLGLKSKKGNPMNQKRMTDILKNPFYYGCFYYRNDLHEGAHEPLITKKLYDTVQLVMQGKGFKITRTFVYIFQNLVVCPECKQKMRCVSAKKQYKYYNCTNSKCEFKNLKEEDLEKLFLFELKQIQFSEEEGKKFVETIKRFRSDMAFHRDTELKTIQIEETRIRNQLEGLALRSIDGKIDEYTYDSLKTRLLNQLSDIKDRRNVLDTVDEQTLEKIVNLGKLLRNPYLAYTKASPENRRRLVHSMVENLSWNGKTIISNWKNEFKLVAEAKNVRMVDLRGIEPPRLRSQGKVLLPSQAH